LLPSVFLTVRRTFPSFAKDSGLLDTHRELPEGCHFVKLSDKPFAMAYFIHDWHPTICSKEKVAELVARTKPVDNPK
jgi:hypothetical protein